MHVLVSVCVHICTHTCTLWVCVYMRVHVCALCACVCACVCMCVHMQAYACVHVCARVREYVCIHLCVLHMCTGRHVCGIRSASVYTELPRRTSVASEPLLMAALPPSTLCWPVHLPHRRRPGFLCSPDLMSFTAPGASGQPKGSSLSRWQEQVPSEEAECWRRCERGAPTPRSAEALISPPPGDQSCSRGWHQGNECPFFLLVVSCFARRVGARPWTPSGKPGQVFPSRPFRARPRGAGAREAAWTQAPGPPRHPNLAVRGRDRAQGRWGTGLREERSLEAEAEGLKRRPELREGDRQRPQQAGGRPRARSSWDVTQWTDAGLQDTRG